MGIMADEGMTVEETLAFRRLLGKFDFELNPEMRRLLLEHPRVFQAIANGQLRELFKTAFFPVEAPPRSAKTMEEATVWPFFFNRQALTRLVDYPVDVDYRPEPAEALRTAGIRRSTVSPPFDDWSLRNQVLKREGGTRTYVLRAFALKAEASMQQVLWLLDIYGYDPVDPRTAVAFAKNYPESFGGQEVVCATAAMRPDWSKGNDPCIHYIEKPNRFDVCERGFKDPIDLDGTILLGAVRPAKRPS